MIAKVTQKHTSVFEIISHGYEPFSIHHEKRIFLIWIEAVGLLTNFISTTASPLYIMDMA